MSRSLSSLVRSVLLESSSRDIRYSSLAGLIDALRPLVAASWEEVREDAIRKFPEHETVLRRTRFVAVFDESDRVPPGVLKSSYVQAGEFVSKCDDLFATTRGGTKCRADGNLSNPPTHNAVYVNVRHLLGIGKLPTTGVFRWSPSQIEETMMHEIAHAVDLLSSVVKGDRVRDSYRDVIEPMFDSEAIRDRDVFLQQVEDRLIQAGASDVGIDRLMNSMSERWDHYVGSGWLKGYREQVASVMQLGLLLKKMGLTGKDFLELNLADDIEIQNEASRLLDFDIMIMLYGILEEEFVDGMDTIVDEII